MSSVPRPRSSSFGDEQAEGDLPVDQLVKTAEQLKNDISVAWDLLTRSPLLEPTALLYQIDVDVLEINEKLQQRRHQLETERKQLHAGVKVSELEQLALLGHLSPDDRKEVAKALAGAEVVESDGHHRLELQLERHDLQRRAVLDHLAQRKRRRARAQEANTLAGPATQRRTARTRAGSLLRNVERPGPTQDSEARALGRSAREGEGGYRRGWLYFQHGY
ncbi:hypothetical protein DMC30DRAFT_418312 [Rhodotorula diobovata]|uniref:Uncharacterized protein n=1 Tax=Rhodotorula diobovata TaxID=5288 RepID=A0A5C5FQD1_9BASI|nr:hypothetical protein DMC30DRAFT_418312 [Rhodotorula diobovata]